VYSDSEEGRKYIQYYGIDGWPYVAILDPRTGLNCSFLSMTSALYSGDSSGINVRIINFYHICILLFVLLYIVVRISLIVCRKLNTTVLAPSFIPREFLWMT